MSQLVSPTVLVVDDEAKFGTSLKRALLDRGSIGSVFVATLSEAADFLMNDRIHIDALVTDLFFEEGDDPERDLYDGLDLIEFAAEHRPELDAYAVSAHADSYGFRQKVMDRKIEVRHLFDKRSFDVRGDPNVPSTGPEPWNVVRLDVYRRRLAEDPTLMEDIKTRYGVEGNGEDGLIGRLLHKVRPPTVTYIESLSGPFEVLQPIEVLCLPMPDGSVQATASKLGLLVDGFGAVPSEAVENLKEVIASHAEQILDETELVGYGAAIKKNLLAFVHRRDDAE